MQGQLTDMSHMETANNGIPELCAASPGISWRLFPHLDPPPSNQLGMGGGGGHGAGLISEVAAEDLLRKPDTPPPPIASDRASPFPSRSNINYVALKRGEGPGTGQRKIRDLERLFKR